MDYAPGSATTLLRMAEKTVRESLERQGKVKQISIPNTGPTIPFHKGDGPPPGCVAQCKISELMDNSNIKREELTCTHPPSLQRLFVQQNMNRELQKSVGGQPRNKSQLGVNATSNAVTQPVPETCMCSAWRTGSGASSYFHSSAWVNLILMKFKNCNFACS